MQIGIYLQFKWNLARKDKPVVFFKLTRLEFIFPVLLNGSWGKSQGWIHPRSLLSHSLAPLPQTPSGMLLFAHRTYVAAAEEIAPTKEQGRIIGISLSIFLLLFCWWITTLKAETHARPEMWAIIGRGT